MQPPPTHSKAHRLGCLVAYRRSETNEQLSSSIHRAPWPETVAEQIEALQAIAAAAIIVRSKRPPRACQQNLLGNAISAQLDCHHRYPVSVFVGEPPEERRA
jgi:hypothetical protein